ncbi:hypothetical protein Agub_g5296 [Astrephomene gubernaculifera]|uniref:Uncharacterized protein n=1 Tax=Astrephomene gubernaculifera TaxID=47775 RepID=A0AAD3DNS6_9CHLO|nr:hypothetical protein Agub_g5296 [Astrephomene gubernaculifera]
MRLLQKCQQLLRGACVAADQGCAFSPSGVKHWESAVQQLGRAGSLADGSRDLASLAPWQQLRYLSLSTGSTLSASSNSIQPASGLPASLALPWAVSQVRGLFGARKPAPPNPQIHTHDKYKFTYKQPTYDFLQGRFVVDRNDVIWHRQANYRHARYAKTASQLTRLKRWKPLAAAYAAKLHKVGFRSRYWAAPNPQEVPGFHDPSGKDTRQRRRSAVPALNQTTGDPALRQSWKTPNRQKLR